MGGLRRGSDASGLFDGDVGGAAEEFGLRNSQTLGEGGDPGVIGLAERGLAGGAIAVSPRDSIGPLPRDFHEIAKKSHLIFRQVREGVHSLMGLESGKTGSDERNFESGGVWNAQVTRKRRGVVAAKKERHCVRAESADLARIEREDKKLSLID